MAVLRGWLIMDRARKSGLPVMDGLGAVVMVIVEVVAVWHLDRFDTRCWAEKGVRRCRSTIRVVGLEVWRRP
jgi:hypothetical protein